jgi:chromatin remodeling complex protein RSC6
LWRALERDLTALDPAASRLATEESSGAKKRPARKAVPSRPAAKKGAKKAAKTCAKKAAKTSARKPIAAFMKAVKPSAALAVVVGTAGLPRTEVTKKLWAYIKRKGLQDKKNRRMIHADDALKPIFKKDQVNMFEMTKLVSRHLS